MGGRKGSSGGRNQTILLRRVEEAYQKHGCRTLDAVVGHLRSAYTEYYRMKQQAFAYNVRRAFSELQQTPQKPSHAGSSNADAVMDGEEDEIQGIGSRSPYRKKQRLINKSEEKLMRMESEYLMRKQRDVNYQSESDSGSNCDDVSTSSSSDAIYEEKVEPEFDLMKSILRDCYSASKDKKTEKIEKNLEVEDVSKEKMLAVNGVGTRPSSSGRAMTRRKAVKSSDPVEEVKGMEGGPRFSDLGGMKGVLEELKMEVIVPLYHPQIPVWLGVRPMSGILLHGPPGCGKTKLAHAIANETGVPFYKISATEVVSGVSGASEENIRELFLKAEKTAPSIVFIDEIDAIASKRENLQREMERRIVTQLMTCMDESHRSVDKNSDTQDSNPKKGYILVIGATNRPDAVDPALRRPGRFDREIVLGVPDENARIEILSVLTRNLRLEGDFDLLKIARATPGFVGADLSALSNKAGNIAMKRIIDQRKLEVSKEPVDEKAQEDWWKKPWLPEEMEKLGITMADFEEAAKSVQPSSKREGFSMIPNVKWEDVGGLDTLRHEFERYIVRRIKHPEDYEDFGVDLETGFLLYGPPGCGKTLIAKAVANEACANFIHIKGPELLNKYVGESELAVRTIFSRARTCAPCILFFDEVDALTTKRGKEGGWVVERLLNQLLIELDGADQRKGVYVIGATNRPEVMDQAVLRPGRFGKLLFVPLPSSDERGLILQALSRKKPIDPTVDLFNIAKSPSCQNLSGADLSALMNEAAMIALEEKLSLGSGSSCASPLTIKPKHFEEALVKVTPSVSEKQKEYYDRLSRSFSAS
ncbi:hypothetical protein V2J09_015854 [Rumex salicifolius]